MFVVTFAVALVLTVILYPGAIGRTEITFPHSQLFIIGATDALNGIMVVFASPGARTPPYLQAVLGNFLIPLTALFRFAILRRAPSLMQCGAALLVILGLFLSLVPTIFKLEDVPSSHTDRVTGIARILWPMCFMLG